VPLACALLLLCTPVAAGADSEISPDRPDVSDSTKTVPRGALQIEGGLEHAKTRVAGGESQRRLGVQATLRAGVTDRFEVQLGGEPFVRLRGATDDTGHGDLMLAVKYRFLDGREGAWWPSLGVRPFVKFPIAPAPIGSERPDFGVIALASFDLPGHVNLDLNTGLVAVGQMRPSGYRLQALTSASLSREVAEGFSAFVELTYASRQERDKRDTVGLNAGVIYLLTKNVALDAAVGTSLAGPGPDYAIMAGVSVRFGR
jgi:opacity protein-like surface antigen